MKALIAAALLSLTAACGVSDTTPTPAPIPSATTLEVRDGWAAPTPGGVDVAAGYVTIVNGTSGPDRLLSASSPRAARVEVHEMTMDGDVMQMRRVDALVIAAGQTVTFNQGGQHLMFFGVAQPFVDGESIPLRLRFEHGGDVDVSLSVRSGGADHAH